MEIPMEQITNEPRGRTDKITVNVITITPCRKLGDFPARMLKVCGPLVLVHLIPTSAFSSFNQPLSTRKIHIRTIVYWLVIGHVPSCSAGLQTLNLSVTMLSSTSNSLQGVCADKIITKLKWTVHSNHRKHTPLMLPSHAWVLVLFVLVLRYLSLRFLLPHQCNEGE